MATFFPSVRHSKVNVQFKHIVNLWVVVLCINLYISLVCCDDDANKSIQPTLQKRAGGKICFIVFLNNLLLWFMTIDTNAISCMFVVYSVIAGTATNSNNALDLKDHCNKTVEIYEDVTSPELTSENVNRPLLCTYRFRSFRGAPRDWVLRIRFKKFKVGNIQNATHCEGGYLQVNIQIYRSYKLPHFFIECIERRTNINTLLPWLCSWIRKTPFQTNMRYDSPARSFNK